jgi:TRAP-type C4-dicarboxylate transport system permease small subunit
MESIEFLKAIFLVALVIVPMWKISSRAGFNGAISLLNLVPLLGFIAWASILAFSTWPSKTNSK